MFREEYNGGDAFFVYEVEGGYILMPRQPYYNETITLVKDYETGAIINIDWISPTLVEGIDYEVAMKVTFRIKD